jgi:hypothetical protein
MTVPVPGGPDLPGMLVQKVTQPVLQDLLHFELLLPSQKSVTVGEQPPAPPEVVWDSARAGWLSDPRAGPTFSLDRGPESLLDPTDDVFPRAIRVVLVVGKDPKLAPAGLLAEDLGAEEHTLLLVDGAHFDGPEEGGFVKIGPEWIRYGRLDGDSLSGLQRGQRSTHAGLRKAGTGVRTGHMVEFTVPLVGGKDDFNGH